MGIQPAINIGNRINPNIKLRLFSDSRARRRFRSACPYVELVLSHMLSAYISPGLCAATVAATDIHAGLPSSSRISLFNSNIGIPPI